MWLTIANYITSLQFDHSFMGKFTGMVCTISRPLKIVATDPLFHSFSETDLQYDWNIYEFSTIISGGVYVCVYVSSNKKFDWDVNNTVHLWWIHHYLNTWCAECSYVGRKRRMNERRQTEGGTKVMMSCLDFEPRNPRIPTTCPVDAATEDR